MGIPVYFKTLVSKYQDTILLKGKANTDKINHLFLDLNCLIHPCCRGLTDEDEMIDKILFEIQRLIEYTEVTDLLYIAIDGIAPKGKMKQQRMRRFKSALERKYSNEVRWNTNGISPGTYFMEKLNIKIKEFIKECNVKTIVSDSDERGEGEHKILHYIKENYLKDRICIYGLDADLIMLSLVSRKKDIYLLRERTEYNIEDTNEEFIYLKIDPLKDHIIDSLNIERIIERERIIDDYIFICFLLGNDFMNHIPSLSLRYGGHDVLLSVYSDLQNKYQGYFYLIDRDINNFIFLPFFKEFISELSLLENNNIFKQLSIRERQYKKIYNQYYNDFQYFKKYIVKSNQDKNGIGNENLSLEDIYRFQCDNLHDKNDTTKMIENLPLLYFPSERKVYRELSYNDNLCEDYFNSLVWTTNYYFNECINWKWSTNYNSGPLIKHLNEYISDINEINPKKNNKEFTNIEQLSYIFPSDSHKLHKYPIESDEYKMIPHLSFNRYLWECHLDFV